MQPSAEEEEEEEEERSVLWRLAAGISLSILSTVPVSTSTRSTVNFDLSDLRGPCAWAQ